MKYSGRCIEKDECLAVNEGDQNGAATWLYLLAKVKLDCGSKETDSSHDAQLRVRSR